MISVIEYAIPLFLLLIVVEAVSYRFLPDDDERGFETRDTATSLSMGAGSQVVGLPWKAVTVLVYAALYTLSPLRLPASSPWTWVLLFFADDLAYYVFHRSHHRIRVLWASHVVHHSSQNYNLSTALRQSWTPMTTLPFWLPLCLLGLPPWMILLQQSISLLYQFFLHTERVDKLWHPIEWVMNTPSHHRVHHGSNNPVPRPQLRRHPHHLGPAVRHLRTRRRAGELRPHQEHRYVQPAACGVPRVRRDRPGRARRHRRAQPSRVRLRSARMDAGEGPVRARAIAASFTPEDRVRSRAFIRAVINAGIGAGCALALWRYRRTTGRLTSWSSRPTR